MIRVKNIKINYQKDTEKQIIKKLATKLNTKQTNIKNYKINKKSLDARNKNNLHYVYEIDVNIKNEKEILKKSKPDIIQTPLEKYNFKITGSAFSKLDV